MCSQVEVGSRFEKAYCCSEDVPECVVLYNKWQYIEISTEFMRHASRVQWLSCENGNGVCQLYKIS